jgi:ketosteroid isomerase-like protein
MLASGLARHLIVISTCVLLGAPGAYAQSSAAEQEVAALVKAVNAAYAANDLPKYFGYYADDLTQWWPSGRVDLATYRTQWEKFVADGGRVQSADVSDLRVRVSPSGDTAIATYLLRVVLRGADGKTTTETNQETDVWIEQGGVWRIVHLHYSPHGG